MLPPGDDLEFPVCIQVIFLGQDTLTLPDQGTEAQQQVAVPLLSHLLHLRAVGRNDLEELQKYQPQMQISGSSAQPGISALSHLTLA